MNRRVAALGAILLTIAPLAACETTQDGQTTFSKTAVGALGGGLVGGLACALAKGNTGTCLAVAVAGAAVGGVIGARMDARDKARRDTALRAALNDDALWNNPAYAQAKSWRNPETGDSGSIRPIRSFARQNQTCKVVQEVYVRQGEPVSEQQTVCS